MFFAIFALIGAQEISAQVQARQFYERAMSETDIHRREALIEESIGLSKSFAAYYGLGNLQLDARRYREARESFQNGLALVNDVAPMAAAYFKIGLACEGEGETLQGIAWLEASLSRVPDPTVARELKRMRLAAADQTQPAEAIARALSIGKSTGATPHVNLQVNFKFNQSDLEPRGRSQAEELGKLLEKLNDPGYRMIFIGHTDEKGSDEYNQSLSLKRAEAVKRYLSERYSLVSTRMKTEGHGRRELLYSEPSEENDRLNRRVEVRLVAK